MRGQQRESAAKRARRLWWSESARKARHMMRQRGLMVGPWVDDVACQKRGVMVPDQMGRLADEMYESGISDDEVRGLFLEYTLRVIDRHPPAA